MRKVDVVAKNLILIVITIVILCACESASKSEPTYETDSDGVNITHFDSGDSYVLKSIPYGKLDYNGSLFTLSNVQFYQIYNASAYSYELFAIVEMNLNTLTDAEVHWLLEDKGMAMAGNVLDTSISVSSEKNGLDGEKLTRVYYALDGSNLKQMFYLMPGQKYEISDLEPSLSIYIKQDSTYEHKSDDGTTSNLKQTKTYYWFPDSVPLIDGSEMPEEYVNAFEAYASKLSS